MSFDPTSPPVPRDLVLPVGGRLRECEDDFVVEEIPLYPASGEGEWSMILVEKRGITTPTLVRRLAATLGSRPRDIGWAGYKDRHALTRQWLTVPGRDDLETLEGDGWRVLESRRHKNKLKTGHLWGNRFEIRVRGATRTAAEVGPWLDKIVCSGIPNGFGPQRFGTFGRNHLAGHAIVRGDSPALLRVLSEPVEGESPRVADGRAALAGGRWADALRAFPRDFEVERHVAQVLRGGGDLSRAVRTVPRRPRDFLISSWQSACFNQVLAARLDDGRALVLGDLASRLPRGRPFAVTDLAAELPRAERLEISATGPLPGRDVPCPTHDAAALEGPVLERLAVPTTAATLPRGTFRGARRPLRVRLVDASVGEEVPGTLVFSFSLPAGSFATSVFALLGIRDG